MKTAMSRRQGIEPIGLNQKTRPRPVVMGFVFVFCWMGCVVPAAVVYADRAPSAAQASVGQDNLERWRALPEEEKERYRRLYDKWKNLSDQQKETIRKRYEQWRRLSPEQQRRIRANWERFRKLPPEEKTRIKQKYQRWKSLPPHKRRLIKEQRRMRLKGDFKRLRQPQANEAPSDQQHRFQKRPFKQNESRSPRMRLHHKNHMNTKGPDRIQSHPPSGSHKPSFKQGHRDHLKQQRPGQGSKRLKRFKPPSHSPSRRRR